MTLKVKLSVDEILQGTEIVISEVTKRHVNEKYKNSDDVERYPFQVRAMITKDTKGINLGEVFMLKLAKCEGLEAGQSFSFTEEGGATVTNGLVSFWSRKEFVQVSLKGDELIVR